jgi:uncharacterized protein YjeT (DUF2065 family)
LGGRSEEEGREAVNEKIAWCAMGLAPIIIGAHMLHRPAEWSDMDADDGIPHRPPRQIRLIGVCCVVIGVLWICAILFGKRGGDFGLI